MRHRLPLQCVRRQTFFLFLQTQLARKHDKPGQSLTPRFILQTRHTLILLKRVLVSSPPPPLVPSELNTTEGGVLPCHKKLCTLHEAKAEQLGAMIYSSCFNREVEGLPDAGHGSEPRSSATELISLRRVCRARR